MTEWLIDKSALARLGTSADADVWANRTERGLIHICIVTRLEVGYSARNGACLREETRQPPMASLIAEYSTPDIEERAVEVQMLLADRGRHRGPTVPDLLVAATAELGKLVVLHVDKHFEMIARITSQPVERLK